MILRSSLVAAMVAVGCLACVDPACAGTIPTIGSGSAILSIDRSATFDALDFAGRETPLSDYRSGGLYVRTNGNSYYGDDARGTVLTVGTPFNPFHLTTAPDHSYADVGGGFYFPYEMDPGNTDWVTIQTDDGKKIYGVEFLYGNGWTTGDPTYPWGNNNAVLVWQTWRDGTNVSSGTVGGQALLLVGTIVGFYDPAGFDELLMKATIATTADTNSNALALDNLNVMLTNVPPAPLIYGSDFGLNPTSRVPALTVYDTIAGCQYRMVYTEGLTAPAWNPVNPPPAADWQAGGGTLTFADTGAPGRPQRFYRVEVR